MKTHSQNNMLYDPNVVTAIPEHLLRESDEILHWAGLPLDTETPLEKFKRIMMATEWR